MRYAICDVETGKEYGTLTELVMMYSNTKEMAYETVKTMNDNMVKAGDIPCFMVVEIDDSNVTFLNSKARLIENIEAIEAVEDICDNEDELMTVVEYLNAHQHETGKHYNIVPDNSKVTYLANWR